MLGKLLGGHSSSYQQIFFVNTVPIGLFKFVSILFINEVNYNSEHR